MLSLLNLIVALNCYCQNQNKDNVNHLNITVYYNLSLPTDSLELRIGTTSIYNQYDKYIAINDGKGAFTFSINSEYSHGYFRLKKLRPTRKNDHRLLTDFLFWEAGDSLTMKITEREYPEEPLIIHAFEGVGADKYKASEDIEQCTPFFMEQLTKSNEAHTPYYSWDHIVKDKLEILDKYRNQISDLAYDILRIKILMLKWPLTGDLSRNKWGKPEEIQQPSEAAYLKKLYFPMKIYVKNTDALANSLDYIDFYTLYFTLYPVYKKGKYDKTKFPIANIDVESSLKSIIESSSGKVRQSLIINFLYKIENSPLIKTAVQKVKQYITDDYYLKQLAKLELKFEENKDISQYTFVDDKGKKVKISDFKGKVLFIDTWFTGCPGCANYYRTVASKLEEYFHKDKRIVFLSINSDPLKQTWQKSVEAGIYCNPSGINLYTEGQKMSHPMYLYLNIKSGPTPMVVDTEGNIVFFNSSNLYDIDKLIKVVNELL